MAGRPDDTLRKAEVLVRVRKVAERVAAAETGQAVAALTGAQTQAATAHERCRQHPLDLVDRAGAVTAAQLFVAAGSAAALVDAANAADVAVETATGELRAAQSALSEAMGRRRAADELAARARQQIEVEAARVAQREIDELVSARWVPAPWPPR